MKIFITTCFLVGCLVLTISAADQLNQLTMGNIYKTIPHLSPYYNVSFSIKPLGAISEWSNIIHFTTGQDTGDNSTSYGLRAPAVFFSPASTKLYVCTEYNGKDYNCWISLAALPFHQFTKITISQQLYKTKVFFKVYVNGDQMYSGETTKSQHFYDVKVYVSNPWRRSAYAVLKDFRFQQKFPDHS